jgi:hypothetical protein
MSAPAFNAYQKSKYTIAGLSLKTQSESTTHSLLAQILQGMERILATWVHVALNAMFVWLPMILTPALVFPSCSS